MTAAELISHYAEVRARLNPLRRKVSARPRAWIVPEPTEPDPEPTAPIYRREARGRNFYMAFNEPLQERMPWQGLVNEICRKHDIDPSEIIGRNRAYAVVACRTECVVALRDCLKVQPSFPTIAKWLGDRDHSGVVHAYHKGRK